MTDPPPDDRVRQALGAMLEDGLANDEAQALREHLAKVIPGYLAENGSRLWFHHTIAGDRAGVGFALVTETSAELAEGAARLLAADLFYPGAALVRQLLECCYLLALAGERREEMADWLGGSEESIRETFSPGQMRKRSARGFRFDEYRSHCERGGHPHPFGTFLLRRHEEARPLSLRSHWLDLAQHLSEIWDFFCTAAPLYDPRLDPSSNLYRPGHGPTGQEQVAELLAEWRRLDPIAARMNLPLASEP
jgi:hypothetical protein